MNRRRIHRPTTPRRARPWRHASALVCGVAIGLACGIAGADGGAPLSLPFGEPGAAPRPPWHVAGLPRQTKPFTAFSIVDLDGRRALRVQADASYGNLVHPLQLETTPHALAWHWRMEQLIDADDLRMRAGDDTALKVCLGFDMPMERVPFVERQLLRLTRTQTREIVPAASVCYVWDAHLPPGTALASPFTRRIRYKVLESGPARLHQWIAERRDVAADFVELFGDESREVPPLVGVLVGADADNTLGHSLAYVADLVVEP